MSSVSKIKLPDNTVLDIKDDRMGNARIFYGTCSTAAATAGKEVVCSDFTNSELTKGALIFVTFTYTNSAEVTDLTLDVNLTGAKPFKKQNNASAPGYLAGKGEIRANSTYLFQYDGTNWVCMTLDYNSTYSALTEADMEAGTATTGRTISATRVKQAVEYWMSQNQVNWNETDSTSPSYLKNKPSIPSAPGTLDTTATTAQSTSASEDLSGSVTLHKVAKTGTYSDLIGTPTIPSEVTETTVTNWGFTKNTGTLTGVTFNGTSATITSGVAAISATIPSAPGTLDTTATTAQSTSSSEALSGSITLHKVAKTGTYSDLIGKPSIPSAPGTLDTTATTAQSTASSEALSGSITLHKVAKTGTYSDLIGTPSIPSAPGSLNTTATTAQSTSSSEALSGSITLHKVAKTGTYSDLIGTPTIPTVPTISTNVVTDKASDTKTASPKAVYDEIHPAIGSSQPSGGMLPNVLYNLGTLSSATTFSLATPSDSSVANHYYWTFDTSSTAPTITWPSGISWNGGSAPTINASKHYEISVLGGIGAFMEV